MQKIGILNRSNFKNRTLLSLRVFAMLFASAWILTACSVSSDTPPDESADATLSALTLSGTTLDPAFAPETKSYRASVAIAMASTKVTATANNSGASIVIMPLDDNEEIDGHQVDLMIGETTVSVVVTAVDGITTQTYTVTVTRAETCSPQEQVITAQLAIVATPFNYQYDAVTGLGRGNLSYEADLFDGSPLPAWLRFDRSTRTFSGTPASKDTGALEVRVTATDNSDPPESISSTFVLTVNDPSQSGKVAFVSTRTSLKEGESTIVKFALFNETTAPRGGLQVSYQAIAGDGLDRNEYDVTALGGSTGNIVIPAGCIVGVLQIRANSDQLIEETEVLTLQITSVPHPTIGFDSQTEHMVHITDETRPKISFERASVSVGEGIGSYEVKVVSVPAPAGPLNVSYRVNTIDTTAETGDWAINGLSAGAGTIRFEANSATATLTVTINQDSDDEDETLVLELAPPAEGAGYKTVLPVSLGLNISDDERTGGTPRVRFAFSISQVKEGEEASIEVVAEPAPSSNLDVDFTVSARTATASTDYTPPSPLQVTIPANQGSGRITISLPEDTRIEGNETLLVTLASGSGYTLGTPIAHQLTIEDDDHVMVSLSFSDSDLSVNEDGSGVASGKGCSSDTASTTPRVGLSASPAPTSALNFRLQLGGTARSIQDYTLLDTIRLGPGEGCVSVPLILFNDIRAEGEETLILRLGPGEGYVPDPSANTLTLTIQDNNEPKAEFTETLVAVNEGDTAMIKLTVDHQDIPAPAQVQIEIEAASGTTAEEEDYTLTSPVTVPASGTATFALPTMIDTDTNDETLALVLRSGSGYQVGEHSRIFVTIRDQALPEDIPTVSFVDAISSVQEGSYSGLSFNVGSSRSVTTHDVAVQLQPIPAAGERTLEIRWSPIGGTARAGNADNIRNDYNTSYTDSAARTTMVMLDENGRGNVQLRVYNDRLLEADAETIEIGLLAGDGYRVGSQASHTVNVQDYRDSNMFGIEVGCVPVCSGGGTPSYPEGTTVVIFVGQSTVGAQLGVNIGSTEQADEPLEVIFGLQGARGSRFRVENAEYTGTGDYWRTYIQPGLNIARVSIHSTDDEVHMGTGEITVDLSSTRVDRDCGSCFRSHSGQRLYQGVGGIGRFRITENDPETPSLPPQVHFDGSGMTLTESAQDISLPVAADNLPAGEGIEVSYIVAGGTPTVDYEDLGRGRLFIPPPTSGGANMADLVLSVLDDQVIEGQETWIVTLLPSPNGDYTLASSGPLTYTLTVSDNEDPDALPSVSFVQARLEVIEGRSVQVPVIITPPEGMQLPESVQVSYRVRGRHSAPPETGDFDISGLSGGSGSLTLTRTNPMGTITVNTTADSDDMDTEDFEISLQPDSSMSTVFLLGALNTVIVKILDGEEAREASTPRVSFETISSETNEGDSARVVMLASPIQTAPLTVNLRMASASAGAGDYTFSTMQITFPANSGRVEFSGLRANDDNIDEPTENIVLALVEPGTGSDYRMGDLRHHLVRIVDTDVPMISVSFSPNPLIEGTRLGVDTIANSSKSVTVTLQANPPPYRDLLVPYTLGGTATMMRDYAAPAAEGEHTITLAAGRASVQFMLQIFPDPLAENDETLILTPQPDPEGAYTSVPATLTITDDDDPWIGFADGAVAVQEGGTMDLPVRITLGSRSLSTTLSVGVNASGDASAATVPATIAVPSGSSAGSTGILTQMLSITANQVSGDKALTLTLANGSGYRVVPDSDVKLYQDASMRLLVLDGHNTGPEVNFVTTQTQVTEPRNDSDGAGEAGPEQNIAINLSEPAPAGGLILNYAYGGGTAREGSPAPDELKYTTRSNDFDLINSTLTVPAGEITANIRLQAWTDIILEPEEQGMLTLLPGTDYQLGSQATHTLLIADNTRLSNETGTGTGSCKHIDGTPCVGINIVNFIEGKEGYTIMRIGEAQGFFFPGSGIPNPMSRASVIQREMDVYVGFTSLSSRFVVHHEEVTRGVINGLRDTTVGGDCASRSNRFFRVRLYPGDPDIRVYLRARDDDTIGNTQDRIISLCEDGLVRTGAFITSVGGIQRFGIRDNDGEALPSLPRVLFSSGSQMVDESDSLAMIVMQAINNPSGIETLYRIGGTAQFGVDYYISGLMGIEGMLVVPGGPETTEAILFVEIFDNDLAIGIDKTLTLTLQDDDNYTIGDSDRMHTLTITDDD